MGPGLVAWGAMMSAQYHLSMRQTQSLLREQWQLPFSVGAISQSQDKALNWLAPHYADIGVYVREQKVAHADETRIFFGSTCYGLWSLCTTSVLYFPTPSSERGTDLITERSAKRFTGDV